MSSEDLLKFSSDIEKKIFAGDIIFPANIRVTIKLREMILDSNVSMNEIATFINADPVLSSRVIALANSSANGAMKKQSVRESIAIIGSSSLNFLAFSIMQKQMANSIQGLAKGLVETLWLYSLEIACTGYAISKTNKLIFEDNTDKKSCPETTMLLGMLLHLDIMFILYSASKVKGTFDNLEALGVVVRRLSGRIHKKLMQTYHIPDDIIDDLKTAYVPVDFKVNPSTEAEILAFSAQSIEPSTNIEIFIPKVLNVSPVYDLDLMRLRDGIKYSLIP